MRINQSLVRIGLPVAFFGILSGLLLIQQSVEPAVATTITIDGSSLEVTQVPSPENPLPSCERNEDCPLPTSYCLKGQCTELQDPSCTCSQPQVLRCAEDNGRARHLFCRAGCFTTDSETVCQ